MRGEGRTGERMLPSPRDVSRLLHEGEQRPPLPYLTLMVMQWGQFLDHDLVHTPEAAGQSHSLWHHVLLCFTLNLKFQAFSI